MLATGSRRGEFTGSSRTLDALRPAGGATARGRGGLTPLTDRESPRYGLMFWL